MLRRIYFFAFTALILILSACKSDAAAKIESNTLPDVVQNPPRISWTPSGQVFLSIYKNGKIFHAASVNTSYWLSKQPLAPAEYCWNVRGSVAYSIPQCFTITANNPVLEDFSITNLLKPNLSRPYVMSGNLIKDAQLDASALKVRNSKINALISAYERMSPSIGFGNVMEVAGASSGKVALDNYESIRIWSTKLIYGSTIYYFNQDLSVKSQLLKQVNELVDNCSWVAPFIRDDRSARTLLWSVAYAYDFIGYAQSNSTDWVACIEAIASTSGVDADRYTANTALNNATQYNAKAAALVASILISDSSTWARAYIEENLRSFVYAGNPFWLNDGGYVSGGAYLQWTIENSNQWLSLINKSSRLNPFNHTWYRATTSYFSNALRPTAPTSLFGDGHENAVLPQYAAQVMDNVDTADAAWYRNYLTDAQRSSLSVLTSTPMQRKSIVTPPNNRAYFKDSGILVWHENASVIDSFSIFMRTGNAGLVGHGHADIGSFVVHQGSLPIAVNSGRYDWYGSPMWKDYYQQSRSHNLPTFSGGIGQSTSKLSKTALISEKSGEKFESATMDISSNYLSPASQVIRSVTYLKPNKLLIVDQMASSTPLQWEWNLHLPGNVFLVQPSMWRSGNTCIYKLDDNSYEFNSEVVTEYYQGAAKDQLIPWHSIWKSSLASKNTVMAFLLDLSCDSNVWPQNLYRRQSESFSVDVDMYTIVVKKTGVVDVINK
nr:heparinase II/III family protein [Deefgea rivuli]